MEKQETKPGLRREDLLEMWDCCLLIEKKLIEGIMIADANKVTALKEIEKIKTNIKKCIDPNVR